MRTLLATTTAIIAACCAFSTPGAAQNIETPIAFDSAGNVRTLTPMLVTRLGLSAPAWPVTGDFVEARLYEVRGAGAYVLVVQRDGGAVSRYPLSDGERDALYRAVNAAVTATGRVVSEESPSTISAPARGPFIRNQMILTAILYAPAAAALTNDGKAAAATWLLATGGSYFLLSNLSKNTRVTRSQNHLATDGALRGAVLANLAVAMVGDDPNDDIGAGTTLAGALGGAFAGYHLGKRWTDGEAHAATNASTFAALTALGLIGSAGLIDTSTDDRVVFGALLGGAVAGYPLGLWYPRRAGYRVTAGDVDILRLTALLGVATAAIPFVDQDDPDGNVLSAALTAGLLGGVFIGDRVFSRRYDHTEPDVWRIKLGALAGGLMGGAVVVLTEPNATGWLAAITGGVLGGTILAHRIVAPERAGARSAMVPGGSGPGRVHVDLGNLAAAAMRRPGKHPIVRVTF